MTTPIFISYYRDDVAELAERISARLEQRFGPDSVFIDVADIAGGAQFVGVIDAALRKASVMLVLIGPRWLELRRKVGHDYVGHEIATALSLGHLVLPVRLAGANMVRPEDVAPELHGMLSVHAVSVDGGAEFEAGVAAVVEAIRRFMPLPATLRVTRSGSFRMRLGKATVTIDGQNCGNVAAGRSLDCVVEPGRHELAVVAELLSRFTTPTINIDVGAGETVVVDLSAGPRGWKLDPRR